MIIEDMEKFKQEIQKYGKKLGEKNMSPATSGNISIRVGENVLISASGSSLGDLSDDDLVLINKNSEIVDGMKKASSEKNLHNAIYALRPDVNAIIHCHSPYVSSFAVCHKPLSEPIVCDNVFYFGEIPIADYALPGSKELVENTVKFFEDHDAVLMANHGIVIAAKDLKTAFHLMETAETYAQILINSQILGGAKPLCQKDIDDIYKLRSTKG